MSNRLLKSISVEVWIPNLDMQSHRRMSLSLKIREEEPGSQLSLEGSIRIAIVLFKDPISVWILRENLGFPHSFECRFTSG